MNTRVLGNAGEEMACNYLISCGYEILARQVNYREGEIDIVAKQQDIYVFVEVKTRSHSFCGTPEEALTTQKKERLLKAVLLYCSEYEISEEEIRVDLIALEKQQNTYSLRHYKSIEF